MPPFTHYTSEEVIKLALSNSPAYQHQLTELTEARHQEYKARKERGINVGLDINLGMQQVNTTLGNAYKDQRLYALGAVQLTIPLIDHGAAKKRHAAAEAWEKRQEWALEEAGRLLTEDVTVTLQRLHDSRQMLERTGQTIKLAESHFYETVENYANGLCDINTFSLGQNLWVTAYSNYLAALEDFWTTHYHLQTLIQHE
jgi:outer membrane protein TolC